MDEPDTQTTTQLFTVRLWPEAVGGGKVEWRGKVQHVLTREARYFRSWQVLVEQISSMLVPEADSRQEHQET